MQYTHKKQFGQHFLHDENICKLIVTALDPATTNLLEVGPGAGALTKYLLQQSYPNFKCVELDHEKVQYLLHLYPAISEQLISADFLHIEPPYPDNFSIIGNFPYNISTQIMFKVLDWRLQVQEVVGMFQKEVAIRIAAKHGNKDYGILSVLLQCYYDITYLFDVSPDRFTPPPKVMSGVIRLHKKETPLLPHDAYPLLKKWVKIGFNQRRKTLRNGFKSYVDAALLHHDVFNLRAEQLSVEAWVELFYLLENKA